MLEGSSIPDEKQNKLIFPHIRTSDEAGGREWELSQGR